MNKISSILVTGSSGYIGKLLVKRLREQNYRVYEFDIKNNPNQDVRNTELLRDLIQSQKIHCVYHLAANRNVDACQNNQNALSINRDCAVALANICDFLNVRFIFASTCAVNDVQNDYSLAKQQAEKAFPKSATILRLTNVVGAYEDYQFHESPSLTENIILAIKGELELLTLHGDCSRNYVFVENATRDLINLLDFKAATYVCSGELNSSTRNWATSVLEYFNASIPIVFKEKKPHDAPSLTRKHTFEEDIFLRVMESYRPMLSRIDGSKITNIEPTLVKKSEAYSIYNLVNSKELVLARTVLNPYHATQGQHHDYEEIYSFKNDCVLILGEQETLVKPNQLVVVPPHVFHKVINNTGAPVTFDCFYARKERDNNVYTTDDSHGAQEKSALTAIEFIKKHGVPFARQYLNDQTTLFIDSTEDDFQEKLEGLVKSCELVQTFDELNQAKAWLKRMEPDMPYQISGTRDRFTRDQLKQAIADYESCQ